MNLLDSTLAAAAGLAALGITAAVVTPRRARPAAVGLCTVGLGLAGAVAGAAALTGQSFALELPVLLPLAGVHLAVDALSGLFLAVGGLVVAAAAGYGITYSRHGLDGRMVQATFPLFAAALLLVPIAASVSTFLLAWELMAASSLLLVLAEHRARPAVGQAGLWYAVMTHLGLVAILLGLVAFAAGAHGESFTALRAGADGMSPALRGMVFVLTLIGFGSKAGMVPLHAWLPRAHPEAPSHVSALMSAAMVNLGVYGIVRVAFDLLGGGPGWWGLLVLAVGAVTAVYGILQATVATDLKRLLAYSTCENLGLVFVGVGAAGIFASAGNRMLAALALAAGLLHLVNHAAFKTLLFLAAGSVLHATGSRDLDALGGLRARMPVTTVAFALGALAAAALPLGNAFVSEWLLLQSLIGGLAVPGVTTAVTMPLAVAAVALSAGLAAATFVKVLGVGFFARPRSAAAGQAHESPASLLVPLVLPAVFCIGLALVPQALGPGLSRAVAAVEVVGEQPVLAGGLSLRLTAVASTISPLGLAVALLATVAAVAGAMRVLSRRPRLRQAALWNCGAGAPSARMEYTATSFAEPLQRVFDDVLAPEHDIDVTPHAESAYLVERVRYQQRVPDRIEHRLYTPVLAAAAWIAQAARVLANGSVHRYLGYGFSGLIGLLVVLAVTR